MLAKNEQPRSDQRSTVGVTALVGTFVCLFGWLVSCLVGLVIVGVSVVCWGWGCGRCWLLLLLQTSWQLRVKSAQNCTRIPPHCGQGTSNIHAVAIVRVVSTRLSRESSCVLVLGAVWQTIRTVLAEATQNWLRLSFPVPQNS